jgi:hypothetical protein
VIAQRLAGECLVDELQHGGGRHGAEPYMK